ncbi:hypothetical protein [Streptomyces sp. NRRL S-87]|uniref:hypothetical protein n=1 Tax=Streptomyces sp. NRRL S-87 TaxID=1463920 RepID=UPI0004C04251|nr:hypothetical protein [Streptomyces sp. NRRL S-87]
MLRLITARRLTALTAAADTAATQLAAADTRATDAVTRLHDAAADAYGAQQHNERIMRDVDRLEEANRRQCKELLAARGEAKVVAEEVQIAAMDIAAALLDDRLNDDERRQELARLLVARRELLGLDRLPRPLWKHVEDLARRDGEVFEDEATGGSTPAPKPNATVGGIGTTPAREEGA